MAISRLCSIPNCGNPYIARGCCKLHYHRLVKYGDPLGGGAKKGEPLSWLTAHLNYNGDECLIWPFARSNGKYGSVRVDGASLTASRYMCELAHGKPPSPDHEAAHSCGRGLQGCVHPKHLGWKTPALNQNDKIAHGTAPRGQNCGRSILTDDNIREIRALTGRLTQREIGKRFGVGAQAIGKIISGKRWSHVV